METAPAPLGEMLRGIAGDWMLPPWSSWWGPVVLQWLIPEADERSPFEADCPALPLAMFEEEMPMTPAWPDALYAYLKLSDGYTEPAAKAAELGDRPPGSAANHLSLLAQPAEVAGLLAAHVALLPRPIPDALNTIAPGR